MSSALELLVNHRITGLPVVDQNNSIVGVVSDFDLLALEGMSPSRQSERTAWVWVRIMMARV